MGVVVVVEILQGLGVFENWVDGLLIELDDFAYLSCCREVAEARACNSGIKRGGSSVGRGARVLFGAGTPNMVSVPVYEGRGTGPLPEGRLMGFEMGSPVRVLRLRPVSMTKGTS